MSNGVTGGVFANLTDLQASKPRVDTIVALKTGERYSIDSLDAGSGIAVNGLFANLIDNQVKLSSYGGDSRTATRAAFDANNVLQLSTGETAILECNPTNGDDIQAMVAWMRQCIVSGDATFYLELQDGVHTVSTFIDVDGVGVDIDIRATASPDFIQINSIWYSSVSGTVYDVTVGVDSALPAVAVAGAPIGVQNAQGTLDTECANGCHIIKSIAGDRLSFVFEINSIVGAPSNGVLDNTLTYGLVANQAVIFKGSLIAQSTGWDGSAREGFINCINGGRMTARNFGIAYDGVNDEHDLIFTRGEGSRFYSFDRMGFAGAGDKVLRSYGSSEHFHNRSYIGGSTTADEIFQGVAGGNNQFVRCSVGSTLTSGFTCGHASTANVAQCAIGAIGKAMQTTALDASISAFPVRIKKCTTAFLATSGSIYGTTATELSRNTLGVDWAAGGVVLGNFTLGAAAEANTADSAADGNTMYNGGVWYQNTALNAGFTSLNITSSNPEIVFTDGANVATLNVNSGAFTFDTYTTARDFIFSAGGVQKASYDMGLNSFQPTTDNTASLGSASFVWSETRSNEYYAGASQGVSGSFTAQSGETVTVTKGLITGIV